MSWVVGVDGGGTRTRAVVLDAEGVEVGRAEGPGVVVTRERAAVAVHAVSTTVKAAVEEAGGRLPVDALWAGLAGAGQDAARTAVLGALVKAGLASVVHVGTDVEAAFHDAFGEGPGILLISGTGSIAWARTDAGFRVRVGGWGHHLGDEGSGYWIGLAALRAVVRAEDGRDPPTALTAPVLERCGQRHARGLIGWVDGATKGDVAALAPLAAEIAAAGDPAAEAVIAEAVGHLDAHVAVTLAKLGNSGEPPPVRLWGGLLADGGPLGGAVTAALAARGIVVAETEIDPPAGAARLARALL